IVQRAMRHLEQTMPDRMDVCRIDRGYERLVADLAIVLVEYSERHVDIHVAARRRHPQASLHVADEYHVFRHRLADERDASRPTRSSADVASRCRDEMPAVQCSVIARGCLD